MRWAISKESLEERKRMNKEFSEEQMKHIEVISQEELEKIDGTFLFCSNIKNTPNAVKGKCSDCGKIIYYQPYNENIERKLCEECTGNVIK